MMAPSAAPAPPHASSSPPLSAPILFLLALALPSRAAASIVCPNLTFDIPSLNVACANASVACTACAPSLVAQVSSSPAAAVLVNATSADAEACLVPPLTALLSQVPSLHYALACPDFGNLTSPSSSDAAATGGNASLISTSGGPPSNATVPPTNGMTGAMASPQPHNPAAAGGPPEGAGAALQPPSSGACPSHSAHVAAASVLAALLGLAWM